MNPQIPELPPGPSLETLRGPVEIPLLEPWQWTGIVIGGSFLFALAGFWLLPALRRKGAPSGDPLSPREAALAVIGLASGREDAPGFAALCAEALRGYCRHAWGTGSPAQATAEFLAEADRSNRLEREALDELRTLLIRCDELKFARRALSTEERGQHIEKVRGWIEARESGNTTAAETPASAKGKAILP